MRTVQGILAACNTAVAALRLQQQCTSILQLTNDIYYYHISTKSVLLVLVCSMEKPAHQAISQAITWWLRKLCLWISRLIQSLCTAHMCSVPFTVCWWRSIVVRPPVLAGELPLSCARLTAGRVTALWVKRPSAISQPTWPTQPAIPAGSVKWVVIH